MKKLNKKLMIQNYIRAMFWSKEIKLVAVQDFLKKKTQ